MNRKERVCFEGAYDNGSGAEYWIPGRQEHTASHPIPAHESHVAADAIELALDEREDGSALVGGGGGEIETVGLMWRGGYEASAHRLTAVLQQKESGSTQHDIVVDDALIEDVIAGGPGDDSVLVVAGNVTLIGDVAQYSLRLPRGEARRVVWRVDAIGEEEEGDVRQGQAWSFTL
eukprot:COSAG06_NODE_134_length_22423_cov_17.315445_7_plen_176_part_00